MRLLDDSEERLYRERRKMAQVKIDIPRNVENNEISFLAFPLCFNVKTIIYINDEALKRSEKAFIVTSEDIVDVNAFFLQKSFLFILILLLL